MGKVSDKKDNLKSTIEAIKKINDSAKKSIKDVKATKDGFLNDITSKQKNIGKSLDGFLDKRRKKKQEKKDIFGELIDITDGFLGSSGGQQETSALFSKKKITRYAKQSAKITLNSSKDIILDNIKSVLFIGSNSVCGADTPFKTDSLEISPKEFDFLNILTVEPTSNLGQILYEPLSPDLDFVKMNKEFYDAFSGSEYTFNSKNGNTLFNLNWDDGNQKFLIDNLQQGGVVKIEDFLTDYYTSVEMPDISSVINNAMLMTIQGDGENPIEFDRALNMINRLLNRLFSVCNSPNNNNSLNQNPIDQFDETDEDIESYFDFDDVEGIDIDNEEDRYNKVLRFEDCGNFTIPINESIFEDFVYLSRKKNIDDVLNNTFNKLSRDAYEKSGGTIPILNLQLSLMNGFILNLPRALVSTIISPKLFFPIVVVWKQIKTFTGDAKELLKKLSKLFFSIIKDLFWRFITEFWKFIKKDLLEFVKKIANKILKNKYKRYITIISALIALIRKILKTKLDNCSDLFEAMISLIETALSLRSGGNIPGFLLSFSNLLPGFSEDKAFMNIIEHMESSGINTGSLYGEENKLVSLMNSTVKGLMKEIDSNSFIESSNQLTVLAGPSGPIVIPPGFLKIVGKFR